MDLFKLKGALAEVTNSFAETNTKYMEALASASSAPEDRAALKAEADDLKARVDAMKTEVDRRETADKAALDIQVRETPASDADKLVKAKANFYRATAMHERVPDESMRVLNSLTAIQPASGDGNAFLPTTLLGPIITEPSPLNPLRGVWKSSSISGLEIPRLTVTVNGADAFIDDDDSAGVVDLEGDKLTFSPFKAKIMAEVSDTVLLGSDSSLVTDIETALRDALSYKELKCAFDTNPDADTEHMSFYQEDSLSPVLAEVTGTTQFDAIQRALYSLSPAFRGGAQVAMAGLDWVAMRSALVNENGSYFSALPEQVLGKPMLEVDLATTPVVGNFSNVQINYNPQVTYDTDKDVVHGVYQFVLTVWFDIWRLRDSAFRLAVVDESA